MKEIKRLLVLQHLEIEGPGLFEQFAKERDLKIEIIRLDNKNALPQTKKGDLILIMGGPMGVKDIGSDRYPWLKFCLLYTSPSPRDVNRSRMPSSA